MKDATKDIKIKNWYSDKYIVANVQKNILFMLTIFLSISILTALILVKYVYENRSVEPYLIEVDKKTGFATIVDTQTVRQFTASDAVRESFAVKYIKTRESYNSQTIEDDRNTIRVMSSKDVYNNYSDPIKNITLSDIKENERGSKVVVNLRSITFTSPKIAEAKIVRNIVLDGTLMRKRYFKVRVVFDFFDIELPLEDRYLNPFGFQVINYALTEEKVSDDYNPEKDDSQQVKTQSAQQPYYSQAPQSTPPVTPSTPSLQNSNIIPPSNIPPPLQNIVPSNQPIINPLQTSQIQNTTQTPVSHP